MSLWISELEARATAVLETATRDFIQGGAGRELTVRRNVEAWADLNLLPHVLRDVTQTSPQTTVLGTTVELPVLVAPMGCHGLAHPGAERETARGVDAAGSILCVPERGSSKLEDVVSEAPNRSWFQIYLQPDRAYSINLIKRAVQARYSAIILTVDATIRADRYRDRANNFSASHLQRGNIPAASEDDYVDTPNPSLTFRDVELICEAAEGLPVVVKGVLRPDDAMACVAVGARGIIVSNHGGRQLESALPTAQALPGVVAAVGNSAEVYVDGGIRTAEDVVKALALGARAVLIGRPALWALATDGASGVQKLLTDLRDDTTRAMALCGARDVASLGPDMVAPQARFGRLRAAAE